MGILDRMAGFDEFNTLVGLPEVTRCEAKYGE